MIGRAEMISEIDENVDESPKDVIYSRMSGQVKPTTSNVDSFNKIRKSIQSHLTERKEAIEAIETAIKQAQNESERLQKKLERSPQSSKEQIKEEIKVLNELVRSLISDLGSLMQK